MATTTANPSSTSTSTPTVDSTNTVDIKNYNETYRVYIKAGTDGKIDQESIRMVTAGKDNNVWEKLDKPDSGYTKMLEQTAKIYEAGTMAGAALIVEDPEECVNIWNRGISQKTGQKLKAKFTEVSADGLSLVFDPTVDPYDTLEDINQPTQKRNLSPADKAKNSVRAAVKAMFPGLEGDDLEQRVNLFFAQLQS